MAKKSTRKPLNKAAPIPKQLPKPVSQHPLAEPPKTEPPAKTKKKTTSPGIAHLAGIALEDPNTPEALRPIIASALAQAEHLEKGKPDKK
jgi:hypothetical protein